MSVEFRMPTFSEVLAFAPLYDNLPYHNFGHAVAVFSRAKSIAERYIAEGGKANLPVVAWASLGHDTNFAKPLDPKDGFVSKEARSGNDTVRHLTELGASQAFAYVVESVIVDGTHRDGAFASTEARIVRAADLYTIGGEYHEFYAANINIYQEACILAGKEIPFADWKAGMVKMFDFYTGQDIHLTSKYYNADGRSRWHENAYRNLGLFMLET